MRFRQLLISHANDMKTGSDKMETIRVFGGARVEPEALHILSMHSAPYIMLILKSDFYPELPLQLLFT